MNFLEIFGPNSDEEYEECEEEEYEEEYEDEDEYAESGYEGTEEDIAATKIQRRFRSKLRQDHDKKEDKAARCIQKKFRKRMERKNHDKTKDRAARCIQKKFRKRMERKSHAKKEKAAICIQRRFRVKLKKDRRDKLENGAATTIQRRFRMKRKKKNEEAADLGKAKTKPKSKSFTKKNLIAPSQDTRSTRSYSWRRPFTVVEEPSDREDDAGSQHTQKNGLSVPFVPRGTRMVDESTRRRRVEMNDASVNTDASFGPAIEYAGLLNLISILALKEPNLAAQIGPMLAKLEAKRERPPIERVDMGTITESAEDAPSVNSSASPSVYEFFTGDKDSLASDDVTSEESDCSIYDFTDSKRPKRTSVLTIKHGRKTPPTRSSTQHFGSVMEDADTQDSDGTEYKFAVGESVTVVPRKSDARASEESSDAVTRRSLEHVIINVRD